MLWIQNFLSGFSAGELVVLVTGAIYAIVQVFVPALSPIQWIKNWTKWGDLKIKIVVQGFFFLLSILAMWGTGEIAEVGFQLQSLMVYFGTWYGWSQLAFNTLSAQKRQELRQG